MVRHDVPFLSQYADLCDHQWRARGCGIVALKMALDFWHGGSRLCRTAPLDALLRDGLAAGAYREGIGWSHGGLAALATSYGYEAFNADWAANGPAPKSPPDAWQALLAELVRGPVLASVWSGMDPERQGGHIILVTGFADGLVAFNDPEELTEREGRKLLALDRFLRAFKRRYVVVRPGKAA